MLTYFFSLMRTQNEDLYHGKVHEHDRAHLLYVLHLHVCSVEAFILTIVL